MGTDLQDRIQGLDSARGRSWSVQYQCSTPSPGKCSTESAEAIGIAQPHCFGEAGRLPLDGFASALGGEVPRAESRTAGRDDQPVEACGELDQCVSHRVHTVSDRAPIDNGPSCRFEVLLHRRPGAVLSGAGNHTIRCGDDFGEELRIVCLRRSHAP